MMMIPVVVGLENQEGELRRRALFLGRHWSPPGFGWIPYREGIFPNPVPWGNEFIPWSVTVK
jgi:hypothetical protein